MEEKMSNLFFTEEHEWVRVEGNKAYIGISNYAQSQLGDIVYVELPEMDDEVSVGDSVGVVESVKSASDLFTPVSGTIVEINEDLEDSPELLNEDAMANWIVAIELSEKEDLTSLMDEEDYKQFLGEDA
ncbi:MAG: glycine cleavage system protein GcvH [Tissierellia bacterium]|nr:glycine cleavage system protein GcvH [Tissierellia bacterium]